MIKDLKLQVNHSLNNDNVVKNGSYVVWSVTLCVFVSALVYFAYIHRVPITLIESRRESDASVFVGASKLDSTIEYLGISYRIESGAVQFTSSGECAKFVALPCNDQTRLTYRRTLGSTQSTLKVQSYAGAFTIKWPFTTSQHDVIAITHMCVSGALQFTGGWIKNSTHRIHMMDVNQNIYLYDVQQVGNMIAAVGIQACAKVAPVSGLYYNTLTKPAGMVEAFTLSIALSGFLYTALIVLIRCFHIAHVRKTAEVQQWDGASEIRDPEGWTMKRAGSAKVIAAVAAGPASKYEVEVVQQQQEQQQEQLEMMHTLPGMAGMTGRRVSVAGARDSLAEFGL